MSHPHTRTGRIVLRPISAAPKVGFPLPQIKPAADASVTLERWLDIWMEQDIEPCRAETTINGYDSIIHNHIRPALGKVRLADLSPELINGYYQWLADEKGLSPNTIRKHHVLLHTALKSAFRQGVVPVNPIQRATPPRATTVEVAYYTPARLGKLLRAVKGDPLEVPVRLACFLGLRRSEILGLRWRDVDLHSGQISIRWVRTTIGSRVVEKTPKTTDSCRTLSIVALDDLLELLRELRVRRVRDGMPCSPEDFLLLDGVGQPLHPNLMSSALAAFIRRNELAPITFHGLRHTFASMANNARVPMYQISRAMGHSNPNITQRIYTHLFDQTHGEVLAAVADVVKASSTPLPSA
mgnify:CR=1 FL=1